MVFFFIEIYIFIPVYVQIYVSILMLYMSLYTHRHTHIHLLFFHLFPSWSILLLKFFNVRFKIFKNMEIIFAYIVIYITNHNAPSKARSMDLKK